MPVTQQTAQRESRVELLRHAAFQVTTDLYSLDGQATLKVLVVLGANAFCQLIGLDHGFVLYLVLLINRYI